MKTLHYFIVLLLLLITIKSNAQYYGNFQVAGDANKFYPVLFTDVSSYNNKATEIEIGRSNVHMDGTWRGSIIAKFRFHTYNWGNGSNFIDADIRQFNPVSNTAFVAGWADATSANGNSIIIIWLKGGSNTYYLNCSSTVTPVVYDGTQNALPYQEPNGPSRTYKTAIDNYVNSYGLSAGGTAFYNGTSNFNYFANNVGIGTTNPDQKLSVAGTIHSQAVKVDMNGWNDVVFEPTYNLPALRDVKAFIEKNHHLPDIPSEKEIVKNGVDLGEMVKLQQKKIEELTLYLIEKDKQLKSQNTRLRKIEKKLKSTSM